MREPVPLYCLPYAGGSAGVIFQRWARLMPAHVKSTPLELPGRGKRYGEPPAVDLIALAADFADSIARGPERFALYGHSMGTILVYEIAARLAAIGAPRPEKIFLSGRGLAHQPPPEQKLSLVDDAGLVDWLAGIDPNAGTFFADAETRRAFLPIVRADFAMIETYRPAPDRFVTAADIVFLHSLDDPLVDRAAAESWHPYTSGQLDVITFTGDHMFLLSDAPGVVGAITARLPEEASPMHGAHQAFPAQWPS